MRRQWLFTVIATIAAAALIAVTLRLGDDPPESAAGPEPRADPDRLPEAIDPDALGRPGTVAPEARGSFGYDRIVDGRLIRLRGRRVTPLAGGVIRVDEPRGHVYLTPTRLITIEAASGVFLAPENHPLEGRFEGEVLVRLYEGKADRNLIIRPNSPDLQLEAQLHDARFDRKLNRIDSDGDVRLVSREFEFSGRGLQLSYNDRRQRIDRLAVAEGHELRLYDLAPAEQERQPATAGAPTAEREPSEAPGDAQHYRATLSGDVDVQSREARITGETLSAVFALGQSPPPTSEGDGEPTARRDRRPPAPRGRAPIVLAANRPSNAPPAPRATPLGRVAHRSTAAPLSEDQVVIRWRGPLVIEPAEAPSRLTAGGVQLEIEGAPARVRPSTPDRGERDEMSARRIRYWTGLDQLEADGDADHPLTLRSADLGTLRGASLTLNRRSGEAGVKGPGWFRVADAGEPRPRLDAGPAVLRAGLQVRWADDLRLQFDPDGLDSSQWLLRRAAFHGDVIVQHDRFRVLAERIVVPHVVRRHDGRRASHPDRIEADGQVDAMLHAEGPDQPPLRLASRSATVTLAKTLRDDAIEPNDLLAEGLVEATRGDDRLRSEWLRVQLQREPYGPDRNLAERDRGVRLGVEHLEARQDVSLWLENQSMALVGDRLIWSERDRRVELEGEPARPARVVRPRSLVAAPRLMLTETDQRLRAEGAGSFRLRLDASADDPPPAGAADRWLEALWSDRMVYDQRTGEAKLFEAAQVTAKSPTERAELAGDVLTVRLTDAPDTGEPRSATAPAPGATDAESGPADPIGMERRRVDHVAAEGDASFQWRRHREEEPETDLYRFRAAGPIITFDHPSDAIHVDGAGTIYFESSRAMETTDAGGRAGADADLARLATAPGRTLLRFTEAGHFNARLNDLELRGDVQLLHRPERDAAPLQLDAQRLVVDLVGGEASGIDQWLDGDVQQHTLVGVYADQAVRLIRGDRRVHTDQLRYTHGDRSVLLKAESGARTRVIDPRRNFSAEAIRWDLEADRYEAINPGAVRTPLAAPRSGDAAEAAAGRADDRDAARRRFGPR